MYDVCEPIACTPALFSAGAGLSLLLSQLEIVTNASSFLLALYVTMQVGNTPVPMPVSA